jgi:hypothetical protein
MPPCCNQGMKGLLLYCVRWRVWCARPGEEQLFRLLQHEGPMPARNRPADEKSQRTPAFLCEVPRRVTRTQERILLARLEAARDRSTPRGWVKLAPVCAWYARPTLASRPASCLGTIRRARGALRRRGCSRPAPTTPRRRCQAVPADPARGAAGPSRAPQARHSCRWRGQSAPGGQSQARALPGHTPDRHRGGPDP